MTEKEYKFMCADGGDTLKISTCDYPNKFNEFIVICVSAGDIGCISLSKEETINLYKALKEICGD